MGWLILSLLLIVEIVYFIGFMWFADIVLRHYFSTHHSVKTGKFILHMVVACVLSLFWWATLMYAGYIYITED